MSRLIFICIASSMLYTLPLQAQETLPQPLAETHPDIDEHDGRSSSRTSMHDVPTYRYPMLDRRKEVGFQVLASSALTFMPAFGSYYLMSTSTGGPDAPREPFRFTLAETMGAALLFNVPVAALSTYMLGRSNGSNARLGLTFVGASIGGVAGSFISARVWQQRFTDNAIFATWLMPVAGAIIGYQLSSTWKTGETTYSKSPALSFQVVPTRDGGVMGGMGLRF